MDWRDFIASLVDSLAWPAAIVVLVLVLRQQITGLFDGTLQRLKLGPGGAELEWARAEASTATAATAAVRRSRPELNVPDEMGDQLEARLSKLEQMADVSPREAVDGTYRLVEMILRNLLIHNNVELPPGEQTMDKVIKAAFLGGIITKETAQTLRGLAVLRDLTVDGPSGEQTAADKAKDYIVLARTVLYVLGVDAVSLTE